MSPLRIVLAGGFLAGYLEGGGHWAAFLQYLLGLRALGHDVWWLELVTSGEPAGDRQRIKGFFSRLAEYGLDDRAVLVLAPRDRPAELGSMDLYGLGRPALEDLARSADLLWNFAGWLRPPLLDLFRHRVLIDIDPGHLHVSALTFDFAVEQHHTFLTVGTKLHDADCGVPTLGRRWHQFVPFVHLPMWPPAADPGPEAPMTSITQWTWEQLPWGDRVLSVSKRDAYLRYVSAPARAGRPFELAANIHPDDHTGDRELLRRHGWRLVHPHDVAGSPAAYGDYLRRSRAEFGCPKPIHRELRTGWFSDRSACYLASGRPVLFEDTGIGESLPTGAGLLLFRDLEEAVAAVAEADRDWARHSRAARALAAEFLDGRRRLPAMLEASSAAGAVLGPERDED